MQTKRKKIAAFRKRRNTFMCSYSMFVLFVQKRSIIRIFSIFTLHFVVAETATRLA